MNNGMLLIGLMLAGLFLMRRQTPQGLGGQTPEFWDRPASQTGAWL
jgi:hypothetical protein